MRPGPAREAQRTRGGSRQTRGAGRRRTHRPRRWQRWARRGGASLLLATLALAGLGATWSAWHHLAIWLRAEPLRLHVVAVEGARRLAAQEVAEATGLAEGTPLVDLDTEAALERLRAHAWIEAATAVRLPPDQLLVRIEERVPRGIVATGAEGTDHVVDARGVPFAPATAADVAALPRFRVAQPARAVHADADLLRAVELTSSLERFALPAALEVAQTGDSALTTLRLQGLQARIVLGAAPWDVPLARLTRLLAAGRPELAAATEIDLRFADRAVLRSGSVPEGTTRTTGSRGRGVPSQSGPAG